MKKGLPDDASMEAAAMVENDRTVVIDASTAYRVDDAWTYGFPELCESQKDALRSSKRISNPGCYPTGFIALARPLVDAGLVPADAPLTVNAISGYSGGGKGLIGIYESDDHEPWGAYGFSMVSDDGWWWWWVVGDDGEIFVGGGRTSCVVFATYNMCIAADAPAALPFE